jgi:hypothetical protein
LRLEQQFCENFWSDRGARTMTCKISVKPIDGTRYRVIVEEGKSQTEHEVTVSIQDKERYGRDVTTEGLLVSSFKFLLGREPKESILRRFALADIERYFPDYPNQIRRS